MVAKLQGVEEYMKGRGLEYLYFSVHDDDIDGNRRARLRSMLPLCQWMMVITGAMTTCVLCRHRSHAV